MATETNWVGIALLAGSGIAAYVIGKQVYAAMSKKTVAPVKAPVAKKALKGLAYMDDLGKIRRTLAPSQGNVWAHRKGYLRGDDFEGVAGLEDLGCGACGTVPMSGIAGVEDTTENILTEGNY